MQAPTENKDNEYIKRKEIRIMWEKNATIAEEEYGMLVDWDERFYICPECGEPVYEQDWTDEALEEEFCPVCGFIHDGYTD